MKHHFLLTYSVHPVDSGDSQDVEKANKVRNDIAKIEAWEKLDNVETVFTGDMSLHGENLAKRRLARITVEELFVPILENHRASKYYVKISCALMVDGLGQPIIFNVEN
ncbi:hypothetical protein AAEH72_16115 [Shewanella xiamenensis]|uniref:hypothetical protein n=1 Tax=Shewanella TaxID=22 RepID=UPI00217CCE40|nr:hypothetical protein [Shewanella xiamenensis]MCT8869297.1 hypothetical protein [Shewanella xiamenensis]MCT8873860.1 hypothetical protein [Shewanella xiamenensis]MCT8877526.1 hypothetical protein [Shewanella xiamenensis]UWH39961.1 hypothetical protein KXJ80_00215 [Shewanella xiamenensis]